MRSYGNENSSPFAVPPVLLHAEEGEFRTPYADRVRCPVFMIYRMILQDLVMRD